MKQGNPDTSVWGNKGQDVNKSIAGIVVILVITVKEKPTFKNFVAGYRTVTLIPPNKGPDIASNLGNDKIGSEQAKACYMDSPPYLFDTTV